MFFFYAHLMGGSLVIVALFRFSCSVVLGWRVNTQL